MNRALVVSAVFLMSSNAFAGDLPDPLITPGAINTTVTQDNVLSTVCIKGWTKTVRPDQSYTNKLKRQQLRQLGYSNQDPRSYEEDHLVPLSLGGHPTDPRNLWPQPRQSEWGADRKDNLEFALYMGVCRNQIKLADAQQAMAGNWIVSYKQYVGLLQKYKRY